ncbi:MAG: hypothetical protein RMJ59_07770 [Candidatus Nitrosocaldus sp.]|nr:hypothetical protein [Candidatus Nitrosocaldus sp.]MDW8276257.1 hypothetical protein [Candidatus Nitrosocaldus sp.]
MSPINVAQDVQHEQYESEPSIVKVRLRRGTWEVEITCREDRVRYVVESVLAGMGNVTTADAAGIIVSGTGTGTVASSSDGRVGAMVGTVDGVAGAGGRAVDKGSTCKGLIERLWHEGWFASERNLGEVHEELARLGYNYDRTAVSHALTDLVREGVLSRMGSARTYRYVQKRPPI